MLSRFDPGERATNSKTANARCNLGASRFYLTRWNWLRARFYSLDDVSPRARITYCVPGSLSPDRTKPRTASAARSHRANSLAGTSLSATSQGTPVARENRCSGPHSVKRLHLCGRSAQCLARAPCRSKRRIACESVVAFCKNLRRLISSFQFCSGYDGIAHACTRTAHTTTSDRSETISVPEDQSPQTSSTLLRRLRRDPLEGSE
jgi:hypothetical protein